MENVIMARLVAKCYQNIEVGNIKSDSLYMFQGRASDCNWIISNEFVSWDIKLAFLSILYR